MGPKELRTDILLIRETGFVANFKIEPCATDCCLNFKIIPWVYAIWNLYKKCKQKLTKLLFFIIPDLFEARETRSWGEFQPNFFAP